MARSRDRRRRCVSRELLLILVSLVVVATASFAEAKTIHYVDVDAIGANDGSSWADAYTDLQAALSAAESGDEIWVAEGTYRPSVPAGRDATFRLVDGVALYGGFASGETSRALRNWASHESILSGDIGEPSSSSDNSYNVVTGCDHAVLDGFTITRGNANGILVGNDFAPISGGGMANFGTSPTVRNCHFLDNVADSGGGMVNFGGSPTVTDCTFEGNTAFGCYGGGMWNRMSSPMVARCTFRGNWAGQEGGGMCNEEGGKPTMTGCTFFDNLAICGGGMCNYWSSPTVTGCTFSGNVASLGGGMDNYANSCPEVTDCDFDANSARYGGGMANEGGCDAIVSECRFTGNRAGGHIWVILAGADRANGRRPTSPRSRAGDAIWIEPCAGGGMCNFDSAPVVTDCTFESNLALNPSEISEDALGGGMFNFGSDALVTGCRFYENGAPWGGGMCNESVNSQPTVTDCTFSGNVAFYGGGMSNYDGSRPTVIRCTFTENAAMLCGGGMDNFLDCCPEVTDCGFSGNLAWYGGGMNNEDGSDATVVECLFDSNVVEETVTAKSPGGIDVDGRHLAASRGRAGDAILLSGWGGGMFNGGCSPTVTACTFVGNRTHGVSSAGGGMCNEGAGAPAVSGCTFSGNVSEYYGGGMANFECGPTVANCTFSGNDAQDHGGGLYNQASAPIVTHCTFFGNSGDGIHNNTSNPTVRNTILVGNSPNDCRSGATSTFTSGGYNLESGTSCGCTQATDQQNTDPLLDPDLWDNGGPTLTHALLPGSPAIDAIPAPYNDAPATDQRGFPRPYPAGGLADIGAVEMQLPYAKGDVNGDGAIDLLDVVLCQQIARGWVTGTAQQREAADVDGDGDVDQDDVTILSEYVLGNRTTLP